MNHANKQTKYDYDLESNGEFRLYPTGSNHYICGAEVFNSYGRRSNDNLLMDYGFSMLCNEWQSVEMVLELMPGGDIDYASEKLRILANSRMSRFQNVAVTVFDFPLDVREAAWQSCYTMLWSEFAAVRNPFCSRIAFTSRRSDIAECW